MVASLYQQQTIKITEYNDLHDQTCVLTPSLPLEVMVLPPNQEYTVTYSINFSTVYSTTWTSDLEAGIFVHEYYYLHCPSSQIIDLWCYFCFVPPTSHPQYFLVVHPTIHHTVEAKLQALRKKQRRYYENTPSVTAESNMNDLLDDKVDFKAIVTLSDCLGLICNAKNKVLQIIPSVVPTVYIENVLRKYAMSLHTSVARNIEIFGDTVKHIEPYLIWAQQGQDKIFNMCGISMLEDLYRLAVLGDLDEAYLLGETMYQKVLGLEAPGV
ncbi:uncharacterized protein BJ212DRAFT_1296387 [Suillus subaureus]|uniref:Uncharacterized protein n=1 Tax=Suillus subaureus TaxID=48587 RepID=A0A9P7JI73_9AGAM|nr:uncharacterized protein BJ212DRAFT_1296387 [Suillus subaureus]KAG1823860.1 hypothetical protein BJ212DRAFT_1296387 [Suillus subaureus]